jgi:hypothetical protein
MFSHSKNVSCVTLDGEIEEASEVRIMCRILLLHRLPLLYIITGTRPIAYIILQKAAGAHSNSVRVGIGPLTFTQRA